MNPGFEIGPGFFYLKECQHEVSTFSVMKGKRQIQHHPRQENKTGKATFASTTSINSSTVESRVTLPRSGAASHEGQSDWRDIGEDIHTVPKTSKQ